MAWWVDGRSTPRGDSGEKSSSQRKVLGWRETTRNKQRASPVEDERTHGTQTTSHTNIKKQLVNAQLQRQQARRLETARCWAQLRRSEHVWNTTYTEKVISFTLKKSQSRPLFCVNSRHCPPAGTAAPLSASLLRCHSRGAAKKKTRAASVHGRSLEVALQPKLNTSNPEMS